MPATANTVSFSKDPAGPIDAHELCPPSGKHCGALSPSMLVHSKHAYSYNHGERERGGGDGTLLITPATFIVDR